MRRGQTVMGFTEAELGFFLTILLLVASVAGVPKKQGSTVSKQVADSLRDSLVAITARLDSVTHERLRSRARPNCIEKHLAMGPLFNGTIINADTVLIGGRKQPIAALRSMFSRDLARADSVGCVESIEIEPASTLSALGYQAAIRHLRRTYYVGFTAAGGGVR